MELPDEAITFDSRGLLVPGGEEWTAAAELRTRHFISSARLKELMQRLLQCRSQVAADREMRNVPPESLPLDAGFIDLPQNALDNYRRKGDNSELGRTIALANRLREEADRIVFLGAGCAYLGPSALFDALLPVHHNERSPETRLGVPRIYFEGNTADNDSLQDLLDLLGITCVEPERREERWGVVVLGDGGAALEPPVAHRVFRREAAEYYGLRSPWLTKLFAAVAAANSKVRDLFRAYGHGDESILTIPENVGGRFSVLTPVGLLPAAIMGLDVRALLLGAAAMTKRFLEEPFDRNPVLQFAAVNYLLSEEQDKPIRVLACWSRKLEGLGRWYDHLVAESLGKQSRGPTPMSVVQTRDLYGRGQQHQEGRRDRVINNLVVKNPHGVAIPVQMADHNEDELNAYARKTVPDILAAAHRSTSQSYFEVSRPTSDLVLPVLSEHTMGQLFQMLMLATVIEARLMGLNPYSQPGVETYRKGMREALRTPPETSASSQGSLSKVGLGQSKE
jgi:glucose-6-phosphate isomerase